MIEQYATKTVVIFDPMAGNGSSHLSVIPVNISSAGDNVLIPGVALKSTAVWKLFLVAAAPVQISFKNGATVDCGPIPIGTIVLDLDADAWFRADPGSDFILNLSAPILVSGKIYYVQS